LAVLFRSQDDLEAAAPLFERALTIWEKPLGPDHPDTAFVRHNLAILSDSRSEGPDFA